MKNKRKLIYLILLIITILIGTLLLILTKKFDGNNLIIFEIFLIFLIVILDILILYIFGVLGNNKKENKTINESVIEIIPLIIILIPTTIMTYLSPSMLHGILKQYSYNSFIVIIMILFFYSIEIILIDQLIKTIKNIIKYIGKRRK